MITDVVTYMTGEFFELLCSKSVLSAGVTRTKEINNEKNRKAFEAGVKESLSSNLLHSSFKVRTNYLFHKFSQHENFHYLSGLLIGTEMKEVAGPGHDIILVSNSDLQSYYEVAFNLVVNRSGALKIHNAGDAMVEGQLRILNRLIK
jgi:2-dehydro-3-deoxygalactonokinase